MISFSPYRFSVFLPWGSMMSLVWWGLTYIKLLTAVACVAIHSLFSTHPSLCSVMSSSLSNNCISQDFDRCVSSLDVSSGISQDSAVSTTIFLLYIKYLLRYTSYSFIFMLITGHQILQLLKNQMSFSHPEGFSILTFRFYSP